MTLIGRPSAACQHSCVVGRSAAGADAAELHRLFCRKPFFHRSDAARFAERANVMIRSGSAEKLELFAVELDALGAHDLLQDQSAGVVADNQPIRFRLIHEVGVDDAPAPVMFSTTMRIAGNGFAQVTADRT